MSTPLGRAALAALAVLLPVLPAAAAPTPASITVDGDDADWQLVLVNPENTARDGDGSTLSCLESRDLDCPVPAVDQDLAGFAWTWQGDEIFFRFERHGRGDQQALVHVDEDRDGLMEDDELVLVVPLAAAPTNSSVSARRYTAGQPGGDPMLSPAGEADGWSLRGDLQVGDTPVGISRPLDADSRVHEVSVGRSLLGLPAAPALGFHVSVAVTVDPPTFADNMAGFGGGAGDTGYTELRLDGNKSAGAAPGAFAELEHRLTNDGNLPVRVRVEAIAELPLMIETWTDLDGDRVPETWLGTDAEGDGDLSGLSDALTPEGDGDLDGLLDLGLLEPFEERRVLLRVQLPPDSGGLDAGVALRVWAQDRPAADATVQDRVLAGALTVIGQDDALGVAADEAWLGYEVTRHAGTGPADLWAKTDQDWPLEILEDALGTGLPEDAVPPLDSDASGLPDLVLGAGESRLVWLRVQVPGEAVPGERESAMLRTLESGIPLASDSVGLLVAPPVLLEPDHRVENGAALRGRPGEGIWFAHRLTHALGSEAPVALSAISDAGWSVSLYEDPDGDGRPHDAIALGEPALLTVERNGGTRSLLLRVEVPEAVGLPDSSRITVSATPAGAFGRSATAVDDAIAAIVRTYEDDSHLVAVSRVAACTPVHAQASGLRPSAGGYRFVWRDAGGAALRVQERSSDALGSCQDAWTPSPGESGDGYGVDIQEFDGTVWVTLDQAPLGIDDLADAGTPEVAGAPFHLTGRDLGASVELTNASGSLPVEDLELRFVVLTPDEGSVLKADGDFLPYTGTEWTARELVELAPGATGTVQLFVQSPAYPVEGGYRLIVELGSRCGEVARFSETSFEVVDDLDGDGLSFAIETSAGTDPADADSDDDGLPDGADGLADSDGDGAIDALDCDSDDDGLADGLESGIWEPSPDTETGAGCFVADRWPLSTTDPDAADTDLGGVPDGEEDANRNGRIDAGETDPNEAWDDPGCSDQPAAELEDLRLAKAGGSLHLSWAAPDLDACSAFALLTGADPVALEPDGLRRFEPQAELPLQGGTAYWLVAVDSTLAGLGDTGR